jgi:hypothetical protein
MKTRADLEAAVRDYLEKPNLSDAAMTAFISSTEGVLNRELREHPRNFKRATWVAEDNTGLIPIPADMAGLERVMDAHNAIYEQYPATIPPRLRGFIQRGTILELHPAPDTGSEIRMDYVAYLPTLGFANSSNWVLEHHWDVYFYGCLREAAVYYREDQRLQLWEGEFAKRVADLKAQGWNQNIAQAPRIRSV